MSRLFIILIIFMLTSKVEAQSSTLSIADSLYVVGNYSKAINAYQKESVTLKYTIQIAKAYKALGNTKKALESYEKSLEIDPENVLVLYDYGKLIFSIGKAEKAAAIFDKLIAKDSLNPNFHYQLGLAKETMKSKDFMVSYKKAFELDKQHQRVIYKLIKNYLGAKVYEKAAMYIESGLANNSDDIKVIGFKAQYYYLQKKYRNALKWFEILITRKKATQYVYEKSAYAAYRISKVLRAIELYQEALKRDKQNYFYHSQLAKIYCHDGQFEKAKFHASQSLGIKSVMFETSEDNFILGMVYFEEQNFKKAIRFFKKALKENPKYEAAQFQLTLCSDSYYADYKEKLAVNEKFLKLFPNAHKDRKMLIKSRIRELKREIHLKSE